MRKIPAVVLVERNQPPILDEIELQGPGPGEVLVELRASGICHTSPPRTLLIGESLVSAPGPDFLPGRYVRSQCRQDLNSA
jgi:hypothetical protein